MSKVMALHALMPKFKESKGTVTSCMSAHNPRTQTATVETAKPENRETTEAALGVATGWDNPVPRSDTPRPITVGK
eukprot:SAG11_NODE_12107_length_721_cov_1.606109_2_plen_76_part_00